MDDEVMQIALLQALYATEINEIKILSYLILILQINRLNKVDLNYRCLLSILF